MRSIYRAKCVQRQAVTSSNTAPSPARQDDNVAWAKSFVAEPTRSAEHAWHQFIVGDLLAQIEAKS